MTTQWLWWKLSAVFSHLQLLNWHFTEAHFQIHTLTQRPPQRHFRNRTAFQLLITIFILERTEITGKWCRGEEKTTTTLYSYTAQKGDNHHRLKEKAGAKWQHKNSLDLHKHLHHEFTCQISHLFTIYQEVWEDTTGSLTSRFFCSSYITNMETRLHTCCCKPHDLIVL